MKLCSLRRFDVLVVVTLIASLAMSQMVFAQTPVVTPDELKQALSNSANARTENLEQVRAFFSSDVARKAMKTARLDSNRVQQAVSTLNSSELAKLASQTRELQKDFAAGALTNEQITYALIALATAVIVLVLVH